eukprot:s684_g5.t1
MDWGAQLSKAFMNVCGVRAGIVMQPWSGWTWPYATPNDLPGHQWSTAQRRSGFRWLVWFLVLCGMSRIGEAAHPGPEGDSTWTFGIANPSGLNSKVDMVANQDGHAWVLSETHLSKHGFSKFRQGLRALHSPWKYLVPGHPCSVRRHGQVGVHSGVMLVSKFPARPLPHAFDRDSFETARLQVAGLKVGSSWVTVGMLYGVPCNQSHHFAKYHTETYVAELIDRVACQTSGPRIICGDFNYAVHELSQLQRLHDCGFREIQDLWAWRHGIAVQPTGRGSKRIDQMWLSPELQQVLSNCVVSWDKWADHAAVEAQFLMKGMDSVVSLWNVPSAFPWPSSWTCQVDFDTTLEPSVAYASLWKNLELQAKCWNVQQGIFVSKGQCGRAQTIKPQLRKHVGVPVKMAREGEIQPTFFGTSLQHARFFKQLRRLQALFQLLQKGLCSWNAQGNAQETWRKIRHAPGFPGGFGLWWNQHGLRPVLATPLSYFLPEVEVVRQLFESFQGFVKKYEGELAQQRVRFGKERRQVDMNLVFRDCKDDPPPTVDTLLDRVEVGIEEVREEDSSLVLSKPTVLLDGLPVVVQGKVLEVIAGEADQLWVESIEGITPGSLLTQERVVMSDVEVLQRFREVWEPRWNKLSHVVPGQWDQICGFLQHALPSVQWNFHSWTSLSLATAVRHKKVRSAKGPDGVSQPDPAALPPQGQEALVKMFTSVETGHRWPAQVASGFVASLAKHNAAQTVDEYRPVTVYSLVYRTWSSVRAKEALQAVAQVVPESVQGGLPARQARQIWYSLAQMLEDSFVMDFPLHGILMDVRRAFNSIPRLPLWCALRHLGFPEGILQAWVSFVSGQTRHFKVRQSVGEAVASNCGLPEGCALSVFGMVIVDWILDLWLHATMPSLGLQAFVDDWGVLFHAHDHFQRVWQSVLDFTGAMDLELDLKKTKLWSTHTVARQEFRTNPLSVSLAARNLGAHQNFSRHSWNSVVQARLKRMPDVWIRLRASLSPYKAKVVAVRMMGWPRALHGISVVHLGSAHFRVLRTGVMRGLRAERKGANPMLHLATNHLEVDPEGWSIMQTLRDARELSSPDKVVAMLSLFSAEGVHLPHNGPTAVLRACLQRLGWGIGTNGLVQDRFGSFCVTQVGWDELVLRVSMSWGAVMGAEVEHRPTFQGLEAADILELQSALKHFGVSDQVYLRCHLDGTLYTRNGRANFQEGVTDRCPWCGEKDGFYHRAWTCPFFQDCRVHLSPAQLAVIPSLPKCLSCHGWPVILPEWEVFAGWLLEDHGLSQLSPTGLSLVNPPPVVDLFVDGTAAHPTEPKLRYAAWAVTTAMPGSLHNDVILGGHVQGISQTPFRAELTAMFAAMRWAKQRGVTVRIWTDCLAVLKGVHRIFRRVPVKPNRAHSDLWRQIEALFDDWEFDNVQLVKVVSHGDLAAAQTPLEEWAFWHNGLTDRAAAQINNTRQQGFWAAWEGLARALTFHRKLHRAILMVLLQSGRKAHGEEQKRGVVPTPQVRRAPPPAAPMPAAPARWLFQESMVARYGEVNTTKIHEWWSQVGTAYLEGGSPLVMISGLQLFLDFYQMTGYEGPWVYKKQWYSSEAMTPAAGREPWGNRIRAFLSL